jgi:FKBP-type peptidyl-prolyl cis-trans isomerase FklB
MLSHIIGLLFVGLISVNSFAEGVEAVDINQASYATGYLMGSSLIKDYKDLNKAELLNGLQQGMAHNPAKYSEKDMQKIVKSFQYDAMKQQYVKMRALGEKNKAEAVQFFASNKNKPGVVTLPSGLQYKIIKAAKGSKPSEQDQVVVGFTGKLLNGEIFVTNEKSGDTPTTFPVNSLIPAWHEALTLMPKDSIWEIYTPAELAYGQRGNGDKVAPNAALIYRIHLIDIKNPGSRL